MIDVLAELVAREVEILRLPHHGGQVALDVISTSCSSVAGLDATDLPVDRDIAHGRLAAFRHKREFALRLDEPVLARTGPREHPRLAAGTVLIPDRHGQRTALVAGTHREGGDMWFGQKLFAFFLG